MIYLSVSVGRNRWCMLLYSSSFLLRGWAMTGGTVCVLTGAHTPFYDTQSLSQHIPSHGPHSYHGTCSQHTAVMAHAPYTLLFMAYVYNSLSCRHTCIAHYVKDIVCHPYMLFFQLGIIRWFLIASRFDTTVSNQRSSVSQSSLRGTQSMAVASTSMWYRKWTYRWHEVGVRATNFARESAVDPCPWTVETKQDLGFSHVFLLRVYDVLEISNQFALIE